MELTNVEDNGGTRGESFKLLAGKTIVLGISGGIAAYKACDLANLLHKAGADVHVIMTPNGKRFVAPQSLQSMSRNPVYCEQFAESGGNGMAHIDLARKADLILIAPATANVIENLAHGAANNLLTTTVLATSAKVVVAPAMNPKMWAHPATQDNVATIKRYGYEVIPPAAGKVACGDHGTGKMASLETILMMTARCLSPQLLAGKRILLSAGGTREPIDSVRVISNRSSGKMGIAIADAAYIGGAEVTLVSTVPVTRPYPVVMVDTALEMKAALESKFDSADALVMAAAVGDFQMETVSKQKIKKTPGSEELILKLIKNPDIIATLGLRKRKGQLLMGFAAESEDLLSNALQKLSKKNLDFVVANDIAATGIGFGSDENAVTILGADGSRENLERTSKQAIAYHLCKVLSKRFATLPQ